MLLHYLFPPSYRGIIEECFKIKRGWKPTFVDSQNTFLRFVKYEQLESIIQNRSKERVTGKIKWHPWIIGYRPSKFEMNHFYVVLDDKKVKTENFLSAVDLCIKIFAVFQIPYPPECSAVLQRRCR